MLIGTAEIRLDQVGRAFKIWEKECLYREKRPPAYYLEVLENGQVCLARPGARSGQCYYVKAWPIRKGTTLQLYASHDDNYPSAITPVVIESGTAEDFAGTLDCPLPSVDTVRRERRLAVGASR